MTHEKLILVDCDGVLLNWEYAFQVFMEQQGYVFHNHANKMYSIIDQYRISPDEAWQRIKQFNESAAIGFLPPLRDAMYYVKRLHEEYGYKFHVITSLSTDVNAGKLRKMNLNKLFGPTAFHDMTFLPTAADKHEALEPYRNSGLWWIEDKPENTDVGHEFGLKSILIEHGHNMYHKPEAYPVVKNWKEAFELITSNS